MTYHEQFSNDVDSNNIYHISSYIKLYQTFSTYNFGPKDVGRYDDPTSTRGSS